MALDKEGLKNRMIAETEKKNTPEEANNALWKAICDYVEENAEVKYQWSAKDPSGSPDSKTEWTGKIIVSGSLSPCGKDTPSEALSSISSSMNSNVNSWTIKPESGFDVSGGTITNSGINLQLSMADTRDAALLSIASDVIDGIKRATPPVMSGSHGSYQGSTTSGKIE